MPLYDFVCPACGAQFEELAFGDETPACPQCGHAETQRQMSVPSPLKTGAFPFKPGPVHPLASKMGKGLAGCGQAGGCGRPRRAQLRFRLRRQRQVLLSLGSAYPGRIRSSLGRAFRGMYPAARARSLHYGAAWPILSEYFHFRGILCCAV